MPTQKLEIIHISFTTVYRYGIATFDWHSYHGPTPVRRKTHEARDWRNLSRRWWADFDRWQALPEDERERYVVA